MRAAPLGLMLRALITALSLPAVAACGDAPTMPASYVQEVAGRRWIAISGPAGLPDVRTWARWLPRGSRAAQRVAALEAEERSARRAGALARADSLREAAARTAAAASRHPSPAVLRVANAALAEWERRAAEQLDSGTERDFARAVADVGAQREAAGLALARGDTATAVLRLAAAAERARGFAPGAVALRLLDDAEARLRALPRASATDERALRLLRGARSALAAGDVVRAVRRAMYARQLIERGAAPE